MGNFVRAATNLCVAAVFSNVLCIAGSINISPVRVDWSPSHPASALRIFNTDSKPTTVQIHAVTWSNQEGVERYADSSDIIINPPILTIGAGKTQVVRVGLRRPVVPERELSYRLFIEETPTGAFENSGSVRTLLRLGVPFFVNPRDRRGAKLVWRITQLDEGRMHLSVENRGVEHERVIALYIASEGAPAITVSEQPCYILAGEERSWTLKVDAQKGAHEYLVTAKGTAGDIAEKLTPNTRQLLVDSTSRPR